MAVVKLTKENFDKEVMQSDKPVLIDFYADWCGPCQMMGPVVEEISNEVSDAKVCKLNIDEEMELAQQYGVSTIPSLLFFQNGKVVNTLVGARSEGEYQQALNELLS